MIRPPVLLCVSRCSLRASFNGGGAVLGFFQRTGRCEGEVCCGVSEFSLGNLVLSPDLSTTSYPQGSLPRNLRVACVSTSARASCVGVGVWSEVAQGRVEVLWCGEECSRDALWSMLTSSPISIRTGGVVSGRGAGEEFAGVVV